VAKIGVKTSSKSGRVLAKDNWKDTIDLIECDQDEWDNWLEEPAAQASGGRGRVRFVRADLRNPVLHRRGR
jgi:hypothetical protein